MPTRRSKRSSAGFTLNNRVKLVTAGQEYFSLLLRLIEEARETIHVQVYIFGDDETGRQVGEALMRAARRKIKVYLLVDGYASQQLTHPFIQQLKEAGVHFRFFEPLLKSKYYYFGRRLHQKLVVTDTRYALTGGINISNNYNDMPGEPAWLDFALYAEGEIAKQLCILCWKTWNGYPTRLKLSPCQENPLQPDIPEQEKSRVRMRRNDWVRRKNQVSRSYFEIFRQAHAQVTIVSSYFLPGKLFRKNLLRAAKRGVHIKLMLAGTSDVKIAKQAERYMYRWLLKNNIEIYEYRPHVLHGKMALCDDQWMTMGSYNVNNISAFASIELNLDIRDEKFTGAVKQKIESIIEKDCVRITPEMLHEGHYFLRRFWQAVCYETVRVLFYLFTFYFRQRE